MKAQISFILILCLIFTLTGCEEHTINTIPAPVSVSSTQPSVLEAEDNIEETPSINVIVAPEIPYFQENSISFNEASAYEMPFAAYFASEDFSTIINVPGVSLNASCMNYDIPVISSVSSDEEGYVDVTISVNSTLSFTLYEDDSVYDNSFYSYSVHRAEYELADYYTGLKFPNRSFDNSDNDTILPGISVNGITYSISENASSEWIFDNHNWKILNKEIPFYELPVSATIVNTYYIHMPEDYDGLVLYINQKGLTEYTQQDLDKFKDTSVNYEPEYVLDSEKASDIVAIRISDYL